MCEISRVVKLLESMKSLAFITIILFLVSCGNEKIIQLPEINHSNITEINDVSAAYLFYNETEKDSVELNRQNLISTTNWLVNVDKRLTLKQIIPHIKFLQEKKSNSSHKNKKAKNYFTCNDTSRKNLGFVEFTNVAYKEERHAINYSEVSTLKHLKNQISINFNPGKVTMVFNINQEELSIKISDNDLAEELKKIDFNENMIYLNFDSRLNFQDYIKYKSIVSETNLKHAEISNEEFINN